MPYKRKPSAECTGNSSNNGVHLVAVERTLLSKNPLLIKKRIRIIESQLQPWSTFFRWPALEASLRADIERLRKALNECPFISINYCESLASIRMTLYIPHHVDSSTT